MKGAKQSKKRDNNQNINKSTAYKHNNNNNNNIKCNVNSFNNIDNINKRNITCINNTTAQITGMMMNPYFHFDMNQNPKEKLSKENAEIHSRNLGIYY
ncbi:Hypothetical predicted protein [Octopus vulgaris]|uniref:Uncharacterized protein n=1 Tax=Octopus vulgaris TaxID=6645 RepID=A0AA36FEA4_OCTVU|nr:Hypothetical predicted protein [Octopus vulgaris]